MRIMLHAFYFRKFMPSEITNNGTRVYHSVANWVKYTEQSESQLYLDDKIIGKSSDEKRTSKRQYPCSKYQETEQPSRECKPEEEDSLHKPQKHK